MVTGEQMPTEEEFFKPYFDAIDISECKPKRIRAKIINDWKENQSISFGGYFEFVKDEAYKNRYEISISIMFLFWYGYVTLTIGRL